MGHKRIYPCSRAALYAAVHMPAITAGSPRHHTPKTIEVPQRGAGARRLPVGGPVATPRGLLNDEATGLMCRPDEARVLGAVAAHHAAEEQARRLITAAAHLRARAQEYEREAAGLLNPGG